MSEQQQGIEPGSRGRIYLAGRYSRRLELASVARVLRALGWEITSRWLEGSHDDGTCSPTKAALEDLDDVDAADTVACWTEGATIVGRARGGRHVEFGYALARGKRLIIVGHRENVFHHVPGLELVEDNYELVQLLKRPAPELRMCAERPAFVPEVR